MKNIRHVRGYCYRAGYLLALGFSARLRKDILILENGRPLSGPKTGLHREIWNRGSGRYSIWKGTAYFSTPDHSDPRTNGRKYSFAFVPSCGRLDTIIDQLFLACYPAAWIVVHPLRYFQRLLVKKIFQISPRKVIRAWLPLRASLGRAPGWKEKSWQVAYLACFFLHSTLPARLGTAKERPRGLLNGI